MTITNNKAFATWRGHRFSRLVQNVMKPNKQFWKRQVSSVLLTMAMCWASQSSAQPTRADVPPVPVYQTVTSTSQTISVPFKKMTYGVCDLQLSITDERDYESALKGGRGLTLPVEDVALNLLPEGYYTEIVAKASAADDKNYIVPDWLNSLVIKRLSEPKHGVMVKAKVPDYFQGFTDYLYVPNKNYVGTDRVDFLVTGKDLNGNPFEMTVKYYINVMSDDKLQKAIKSDKAYQNAVKNYCGHSKQTWRISESETPSPLLGNYSNSQVGWAIHCPRVTT